MWIVNKMKLRAIKNNPKYKHSYTKH